MSILINRCDKRVHMIEELLEDWEREHDEAKLASDVGQLCSDSIDLCQFLEASWRELFNSLFQGPFFNTEVVGRRFQDIVRRSLKSVGDVRNLVAEVERQGFAIEQAPQLAKSLEQIQAVDRIIEKKWPFVDMRMVEESREDIRRGDHQTIEELLHAAQSGHAFPD